MDAMQVLQEQAAERERALKAFARREALEAAARLIEERTSQRERNPATNWAELDAAAIRALIDAKPEQ